MPAPSRPSRDSERHQAELAVAGIDPCRPVSISGGAIGLEPEALREGSTARGHNNVKPTSSRDWVRLSPGATALPATKQHNSRWTKSACFTKIFVQPNQGWITYTPKGIRTPVASVKRRCPRPLDDGGEATAQKPRPRSRIAPVEPDCPGRTGFADGMDRTGRRDRSSRSLIPEPDRAQGFLFAWCSSGEICPLQIGTVKWKQAPSPGSDTTQMRPPCTSAMRRQTDRPTP